jgi:hypothetical protein
MAQHDMIIDNASGSSVRADLNNALQALATNSKGASVPATAYAGQLWLDDHHPSLTVWSVYFYDGVESIKVGELDTSNNVFTPLVGGLTPGGRLTLTSTAPVMPADVVGATTIYYTPYVSATIPIYDGDHFLPRAFGEISLVLDSNAAHAGYQQAGNLYDLFVVNNGGTIQLATGPAWSSGTSRGSGGITTELQQLGGLWTNKNAITVRFGNSSGNTLSLPANQGTYVGTMFASADGQAKMQFRPSAASGGSNNGLCLYNAYNRVPVTSESRDSTSTWTYATSSWRAANNSTANRISFIDGLQQSFITAACLCQVSESGGQQAQISATLDGTTGPGNTVAASFSAVGTTIGTEDVYLPQLGFHFVQATETSSGATSTFTGAGTNQSLSVTLEM